MKYRWIFYLILIPLVAIGFVWLFLKASAFFAQPNGLPPTPTSVISQAAVTPSAGPTLTVPPVLPSPSPTIRMIVGPFDQQQAPALTLNTLDGKPFNLADSRGKVVLLNFWASWCMPCKEEMPLLQAAYEQHRDSGLVVLGINTSYQDDRKAAEKFVQETGAKFPILMDESGSASQDYRVISIPMSFFVDREGIIRHYQMGAMNAQQLQQYLEDMLQ